MIPYVWQNIYSSRRDASSYIVRRKDKDWCAVVGNLLSDNSPMKTLTIYKDEGSSILLVGRELVFKEGSIPHLSNKVCKPFGNGRPHFQQVRTGWCYL